MNQTHDPGLTSWDETANGHPDFPIQNLPFGVFRRRDDENGRCGIAIGDHVVDVASAHSEGLLDGAAAIAAEACRERSLNALMALGRDYATPLREQVSALLRRSADAPRAERIRSAILHRRDEVTMLLPATVGDYTDFYASVHHATNVGSMFRPDNPLLPNYKWIPIGYHGRASSVVPSGSVVKRPHGQLKPQDAEEPVFAPARLLDYELEVGAFIARGNPLGTAVPIAEAERHIFGICLVNDWSARDVQTWEYQPLGPFLAKSFATSVSPWVVTMDALEPFRIPPYSRPEGDPDPLPHLDDEHHRSRGGIALSLEVWLRSSAMRASDLPALRVSKGTFTGMYWTFAQMLAHHTSNGCNLLPGDLLASGTVSGPDEDSRGCMLERTWRGTKPLALPNGETRRFLEDGDEVILRGWCEREGAVRIGLGECRGVVAPAG